MLALANNYVNLLSHTGSWLMVAAGLNKQRSVRHAAEVVRFGLDLVERVRQLWTGLHGGERVELRVGISTGHCCLLVMKKQ